MLEKMTFILRGIRFLRSMFGFTPEYLSLRFYQRKSQPLINTYLANNPIAKLQIGAQSNSMNGWLNVDVLPKSHDVVYMDAAKPFPFQSNTFDYIYSEHMIEHISFQEAKIMMAECFRALKRNGRIRISTPDLAFLINLYQNEKSETEREYIKFSTERYLKNQTPSEDVYVINNFFRDWGHQFIHDYKSLSTLLIDAGFVKGKKWNVMESDDANLRNLEQHGKEISDSFNKLESIIVEAVKP